MRMPSRFSRCVDPTQPRKDRSPDCSPAAPRSHGRRPEDHPKDRPEDRLEDRQEDRQEDRLADAATRRRSSTVSPEPLGGARRRRTGSRMRLSLGPRKIRAFPRPCAAGLCADCVWVVLKSFCGRAQRAGCRACPGWSPSSPGWRWSSFVKCRSVAFGDVERWSVGPRP
ncbi:hypothetical protein M885DRAFT_302340 [Pelagophyceae sp. CCMP2097]|nr:hypothetical protein M885DRAFT_302340 [Pelagophyceae sp. CCMP2097]